MCDLAFVVHLDLATLVKINIKTLLVTLDWFGKSSCNLAMCNNVNLMQLVLSCEADKAGANWK